MRPRTYAYRRGRECRDRAKLKVRSMRKMTLAADVARDRGAAAARRGAVVFYRKGRRGWTAHDIRAPGDFNSKAIARFETDAEMAAYLEGHRDWRPEETTHAIE